MSNQTETWNGFYPAASKLQVYFLLGDVLTNSYILLKSHQAW